MSRHRFDRYTRRNMYFNTTKWTIPILIQFARESRGQEARVTTAASGHSVVLLDQLTKNRSVLLKTIVITRIYRTNRGRINGSFWFCKKFYFNQWFSFNIVRLRLIIRLGNSVEKTCSIRIQYRLQTTLG